MSTDELWDHLTKDTIHEVRFFGRPYITISHEHFAQVQHHFKPAYNILNRWQNFRSKTWRRHIHAIKFSQSVQVHIDHFNPNAFIVLSIPHFVCDVVPYLSSALVTRRDRNMRDY